MIIVQNNSGLGNRLKNVVTAMRKAEKLNDQVLINFPHERYFKIKNFSDSGASKQEKIICTTWSLELFEEEYREAYLKKERILKIYHDYSTVFELKNSIDFQYENIQDWMISRFTRFFKRIEFNSTLLEMVDEYSKVFQIKDSVGVHIRSWVDDQGRKARLHDLRMFVDEMQKRNGCRFFLCTDCKEIQDEVLRIFPNRVFGISGSIQRHVSVNENDLAFYHAFLDLLLLSKCREIIGTYSSTFSEVAWWLSSCKQPVTIPLPTAIHKLYRGE